MHLLVGVIPLLSTSEPSTPPSVIAAVPGVGFLQHEYVDYAAAFSAIVAASHEEARPALLDTACAAQGAAALPLSEVTLGSDIVTATTAQLQCDAASVCIVTFFKFASLCSSGNKVRFMTDFAFSVYASFSTLSSFPHLSAKMCSQNPNLSRT